MLDQLCIEHRFRDIQNVIFLLASTSIYAQDQSIPLKWYKVMGDDRYLVDLKEFSEMFLTSLSPIGGRHSLALRREFSSYQEQLEALIHCLAHVSSHHHKLKAVAVPCNPGAYTRSGLTYRVTMRLKEILLSKGLLRLRRGAFNRATQTGVNTRVEPTNSLNELMFKSGLIFSGHPYRNQPTYIAALPYVLINRTASEDDHEEDTDDTLVGAVPIDRPPTQLEQVIPLVNTRLAATRIEVAYPDYPSFKKSWDFRNNRSRGDVRSPFLARVFKNEDGVGGRLYASIQNMPRHLRPFLTFDGEATCELDYKGMQVHMAYSLLGKKCLLIATEN